MSPTLEQIIYAALAAKGQWLKKLNEIREAYPDSADLVDSAIVWLEAHVTAESLAALPGVVVGEIRNLLETGSGPVTHDQVDLT